MKDPEENQLLLLLLSRLERISADSYWAHRASGVRGSLIQVLEKLENHESVQQAEVNSLVNYSLKILDASAQKQTRKVTFNDRKDQNPTH